MERLALLAVVAIIALSGIRLCTGPEETLAFLLYDDAYYYFGVARNLAGGHGSTFDGINPTNGYHPLWCWILVPVFALVDDPGHRGRSIVLRSATRVAQDLVGSAHIPEPLRRGRVVRVAVGWVARAARR